MPVNFSSLSSKSIIGRLLRFPLRFIPRETQVPIVQGKAKGLKWITGSGNHGYWLGSYEYEKQNIFSEYIKEGNIVYDIGANVGFYSLIASRLVGETGHIFAFEPLPRNMKFLCKHLMINNVTNVTAFDFAITNSEGSILFDEGLNSFTGHVSSSGKMLVQTISLDHLFLSSKILLPHVIKIDIEGAEFDALIGAEKILEKSAPIIFLATHDSNNPGVHSECCKFLKSKGYRLSSLEESLQINETDELIAVPKGN